MKFQYNLSIDGLINFAREVPDPTLIQIRNRIRTFSNYGSESDYKHPDPAGYEFATLQKRQLRIQSKKITNLITASI